MEDFFMRIFSEIKFRVQEALLIMKSLYKIKMSHLMKMINTNYLEHLKCFGILINKKPQCLVSLKY